MTIVHRLFEDFLDSVDQYKACERYWENLVRDTAESLGQVGQWKRWIPQHHPDGSPVERDGNPIFDGRSEKLNRAFRLIQHRALGTELEIAAWLKKYEAAYPELPAYELVINLSLSRESAQLAQKLLRKWMTPITSPEEMQSTL